MTITVLLIGLIAVAAAGIVVYQHRRGRVDENGYALEPVDPLMHDASPEVDVADAVDAIADADVPD